MTDLSNLNEAARAVADPSTSAADLAAITQAQPSLWTQVAAQAALTAQTPRISFTGVTRVISTALWPFRCPADSATLSYRCQR